MIIYSFIYICFSYFCLCTREHHKGTAPVILFQNIMTPTDNWIESWLLKLPMVKLLVTLSLPHFSDIQQFVVHWWLITLNAFVPHRKVSYRHPRLLTYKLLNPDTASPPCLHHRGDFQVPLFALAVQIKRKTTDTAHTRPHSPHPFSSPDKWPHLWAFPSRRRELPGNANTAPVHTQRLESDASDDEAEKPLAGHICYVAMLFFRDKVRGLGAAKSNFITPAVVVVWVLEGYVLVMFGGVNYSTKAWKSNYPTGAN